ncbi:unnamed protein product [Clonostachys byssicola]|uniref:Vacuolar protein sorting-associated protein 51 homolog n=1 Tax=Clonostachys byssicola TaxID=160290 RepID=A0A9N9Y6U3_9HYPO|nr:unnamed protein product [Clonostachys byssicola]
MSTIASPRDHSTSRRTPTSSNRPSLDSHRSNVGSPVITQGPTQPPPQPAKRANRAALREYYNLRSASSGPPKIELPDSEVPVSDIDAPNFDADRYVQKVMAESSLAELLSLYARVLGEGRALDAEKKALVYDNYSKLISATETIRKMRSSMDPLNPMASTLDPAIAQIYSQASAFRDSLRESIPSPDSEETRARRTVTRRRRTEELAVQLLETPARIRSLVKEGKLVEAKRQWLMPRKLLVSWKELGEGGDDVQACIEEGDAALESAAKSETTRPSSDDS